MSTTLIRAIGGLALERAIRQGKTRAELEAIAKLHGLELVKPEPVGSE